MARARSRRGFTLIEVMGAVVLLGLVVTYVSRAAIQGMGFAGDAQRRLAASLLADRIVTEIEETGASGGAPQLGERQLEEDDLRATVRVEPLDPAAFGLAALLEPEDRRAAPVPSLFEPARGAQPAVFAVDVRVHWADGIEEQEVVRSTVLLTPTAVPELAALAESEGAGAAGGSGSSGTSSGGSGAAGPAGSGPLGTGAIAPPGGASDPRLLNPRVPRRAAP